MRVLNIPRANRNPFVVGSGFDDFCFELEPGESLPPVDEAAASTQSPEVFLREHDGVNLHFLACFSVAAPLPGVVGLIAERDRDVARWLLDAMTKQKAYNDAKNRSMPYMPGMPRFSYDSFVVEALAGIARAEAHRMLKELE